MTNIPQAYKYRYNGVIYIGGALPEGAELLETINRIDVKTAQTIETMDIVDPKADISDLDGKANIDLSNCTKPHIVETYVNGTSWYRVYSDGWIAQGGRSSNAASTTQTTVTFIKAFTNPNSYKFFAQHIGSSNAMATMTHEQATTTNIKINYSQSYSGGVRAFDWIAFGY